MRGRGSYVVTLRVTNSAGTCTTQIWSSRFMSNYGLPQAQVYRPSELASDCGKSGKKILYLGYVCLCVCN